LSLFLFRYPRRAARTTATTTAAVPNDAL
jgi:hypothetical protein